MISGHIDNSELNLDAPLVAISIGQPAVFLMGGPSLDDRPSALWLRSGDVMIMTGPSRLCYHAVPRIHREVTFVRRDDEDVRVIDYLNENRLNINVRQVN